jgi:AcrR family transcriptional regulator
VTGQTQRKSRPPAPSPRPATRRGRPSASRVAAIDEAIRAAALEAFLTAGFAAASMDAIAAAARVSKGTLYVRYPSKEALFRTVLEAQLELLSQRAGAMDHLLPDELEPRLRHHARTLIRAIHWSEYERVAKLVASAALTFPDVERLWQEIGVRRYLRFLAADMAKTARKAGHPPADWAFFADLFLHAISGWYRTEAAAGALSDARAEAFCDAVIATIMASVRPGSTDQNDKKRGKRPC